MYEELVKRLRDRAKREDDYYEHGGDVIKEAADAIEELQQTVEHYKGCADDWYRDACDYKAICEQMKATIIVEAQHTEMFDERDRKTLMEMAKSLPLQIIPYKDEKPRWIPVTERLPEKNTWVLAYCKYKDHVIDYVDTNGLWSYGNVTHWIPLPEPPKEENERLLGNHHHRTGDYSNCPCDAESHPATPPTEGDRQGCGMDKG